MKSLFFVLLLSCQLPFAISLTANLTYSHCRPPNNYAFSFECAQDHVTWIVDALFGETLDPPMESFCYNALPNRTAECIPQRSINTRDIRLACNTVRGPCQPTGPAEIMHLYTFENCSASSKPFTYAYSVYDCLPALRATDDAPIDYVYINQTPLPKASSEKIYLMSAGYDSKGYTTSPVNRCSVKVSSSSSSGGALSTVRFTVLDLLGQTTAASSSSSSCPYTLSISAGSGYSKVWCAQPTWDYFGVYTFDVPANSGTQQIDVSFNAATSDAASAQGRLWILVEGLTSDGTAASIEISSGGMITAPTDRPTPTRATTSTTTTTTTTTTSPTTTTSSTTTTTTIRITTNTSPKVTASTSTSVAATVLPSTAPTTTTSTSTTAQPRSTIGQPTITTTTSPVVFSVSSIPTGFPTAQQSQSMNWSDSNSSISSTEVVAASVEPEFNPKTSSYVIAVAVGVSVVGIILLCVAIPAIVCLCMYCSDKKHRSKNRRRPTDPIPDSPTLTREDTLPIRSATNPSSVVEQAQAGQPRREEIYSKIDDESQVGVTIIHTAGTIGDSDDLSTVEHHIKVRYTVGGGRKDKKPRRFKRRPKELDEAQWDSSLPPSYSNRDKAHNPSDNPAVPKVQRNPIFFGEEDYNY